MHNVVFYPASSSLTRLTFLIINANQLLDVRRLMVYVYIVYLVNKRKTKYVEAS